MARTEAAKALEAKQKAAVKAEKERRKNSDDPRDWGQVRQIREVFKMISTQDPAAGRLLVAALVGPFLLLLVLGFVLWATVHMAWWNIILMAILGLALGALLAMWLLNRKAKTAMIGRVEGQAGSGEVVLQQLGKDWVTDPVIAFTRQQDVVHRALGPTGLWLIGEGDTARVRALLAQETKRHETAIYGIKVKPVLIGNGQGQVPLKDLEKHLLKAPKQLDAAKIEEASRRFRAIDSMRRKMSIPHGPVPTSKGQARAMRGR